MVLKRLAEFKRRDYTYESPDGDSWEITIVQTDDRKYVEIKRGDDVAQWDIDMLLDIAQAVKNAVNETDAESRTHALQKPNIIDQRPSESIQASVSESLEQLDKPTVDPVESFSPDALNQDVERRLNSPKSIPADKRIKRGSVGGGDLFSGV